MVKVDRPKGHHKPPETTVNLPEVVIEGRKIEVPQDLDALKELKGLFGQLSVAKQDWLLTRFPFCEADTEATTAFNSNRLAEQQIPHNTVKEWKVSDLVFGRVYELLASRCVDFAVYLAMSIETGNAILGAVERRRLLLTPWDKLDSRGTTAKSQAAESSLDRIVGRRERLDITVVRLADLVKEEL